MKSYVTMVRSKSAAVKDIDIDVDIGKGDIDPSQSNVDWIAVIIDSNHSHVVQICRVILCLKSN